MNFGIRNKIALVTASSQGLGRACAEAIAAEGAKIAICARDGKKLAQAADEIAEATGTEVLALPADVSNAREIEQVVKETIDHFGGLHILVTNAGGPASGPPDTLSDRDWQESFNLTMMSVVRLIRAVIPQMTEQQWGRIINITSLSVKEPLDSMIISNALRPAIHGMAKTMSNLHAKDGITINNVMPGFMHTPHVAHIAERIAEQGGQTVADVLAEFGRPAPIGRIGRPEEVGAVVAFLASEQASYITGASIPVDGGRIKSPF
ncbi:MAG: SDR family oxidoreductase [Anaerolineae bacterium]|nr:SDR family oxidoreductase [Anaerolineae bacterium]